MFLNFIDYLAVISVRPPSPVLKNEASISTLNVGICLQNRFHFINISIKMFYSVTVKFYFEYGIESNHIRRHVF
jgi:hypothetical protein